MESYRYSRDSDGTDETFDLYREDVFLLSIPYWDDKVQAEALIQHIVAAMNAYEKTCKNPLPLPQPKC